MKVSFTYTSSIAGIGLAIVLLYLLLTCNSCYNERRATSQFSKAVVAYPKIAADFCANTYSVKDSVIKDTVMTSDTVIDRQILTDTLIQVFADTVRITITKTLPGKVITNTIHLTDTVYRENKAALKVCEIDKSKLTALLTAKTSDYDKMKHRRNVWMIIALVCIGIIGISTYLKLSKISLPKL